MVLLETPDTDNNFALPHFELPAVEGRSYKSADFSADVKVFMFICNHCPYVKAIEERLVQLAHSYKGQSVDFVAICSNDAQEYPDDSFENIKQKWEEANFGFPYLYDENQEVAKAFGAICTPDIFVFDSQNRLFYRGRLDDNWQDASSVDRQELKMAIDQSLDHTGKELVSLDFKIVPSMGCSIKWRS